MNIRINHMQLINKENDHTLAICEIILNECFRIRGVKLMKSAHEFFYLCPLSDEKIMSIIILHFQ